MAKKSKILLGKTGLQALETVLSYSMLRMEAAKTAKKLFGKFGSFSGVLEAPSGEIQKLFSNNTFVEDYIHMIQECCEFYLEDKSTGLIRVFDTESAVEVLKSKFVSRKQEAVALLLLDGRGRVMFNDIINEGSVSEVPIYIRRVVELCLMYDAYDAIIAHNHPSGNPKPSRNDFNATRDVEFALNGIDVSLTDHIIFTDTGYTSLKSVEWLEQIKNEVLEYKKALKSEVMEEEAALEAKREKNRIKEKK
jgi:DNA repair proteins